MELSVSQAIWQESIDKGHIPNIYQYKIIIAVVIVFSRKTQYFEDFANLFKAFIKCGLEISPYKYQLFKDHSTYMGLIFMLKDVKPLCTLMKIKCSAIINFKPPKLVKNCWSFCGMVNLLSSFLKDLRKHLKPIYELKKNKTKFEWASNCQTTNDTIK